MKALIPNDNGDILKKCIMLSYHTVDISYIGSALVENTPNLFQL